MFSKYGMTLNLEIKDNLNVLLNIQQKELHYGNESVSNEMMCVFPFLKQESACFILFFFMFMEP